MTNDKIDKRLTELKGELRSIHGQQQSKRDKELWDMDTIAYSAVGASFCLGIYRSGILLDYEFAQVNNKEKRESILY